MATKSLAILCDYEEEMWPSMDQCGRNLHEQIMKNDEGLRSELILPKMKIIFQNINRESKTLFNADRFLNRYINYPNYVEDLRSDYDFFHLVDHSYAHLIHSVRASKPVGVQCHDLEAFQFAISSGNASNQSWFYKVIVKKIMDGFRKADIVFCPSECTLKQVVMHGLADAKKVILAPLGISNVFFEPVISVIENETVKNLRPKSYLLNVGNNAPRKRLDFLLSIFKQIHKKNDLKLIQVGGVWTQSQLKFIKENRLEDYVVQFPYPKLNTHELKFLYQHALLTIQPSIMEGFGLPIIEALACRSIVIASDIAIFQEIGGNAVVYCESNNINDWCDKINEIIQSAEKAPCEEDRISRAAAYSWSNFTQVVCNSYLKLL